MVRYLRPEEILMIHARIIDATGGAHGVRDVHLLASIAERPKMRFGEKDLYPSFFDKAAVYFESTARHHVFIDGNKRTAIALAARFLFLNGYDLKTTEPVFEKFVLTAVLKKYDVRKTSAWLREHSRRKVPR